MGWAADLWWQRRIDAAWVTLDAHPLTPAGVRCPECARRGLESLVPCDLARVAVRALVEAGRRIVSRVGR